MLNEQIGRPIRRGNILIPCGFNFLRIFRGDFEMSFNEWVVNNSNPTYPSAKQAYKAGAASRQGEIDELRSRLDTAESNLNNSFKTIELEQRFSNKLQKRIDEVMSDCIDFYNFGDGEEAMAFCNEVMNKLKGKKDE